MKKHYFGLALLLAACGAATLSEVDRHAKNPYELGRLAGAAEVRFNDADPTEDPAVFMRAGYRACELARDEMKDSPSFQTMGEDSYDISSASEEFAKGYLETLQNTPAATTKPLQQFVTKRWWKAGAGCANILRETPSWALE